MSTCAPEAPSLDICPTQEQVLPQLLALLPRGRAWGSHDGGPWPGSTLYNFWNAVAAVFAWVNAQICALRLEFFCASETLTDATWLAQYGLPDACDPYPDLCAKVAAQGGQTCHIFQTIAALNGWAIACFSCTSRFGATIPYTASTLLRFGKSRFGKSFGHPQMAARAGGARFGATVAASAGALPRFGAQRFGRQLGCIGIGALAGHAHCGAQGRCVLPIAVYTASSPSWSPPNSALPRFGAQRFGWRLGCGQNSIAALQCLLERVLPAHVLPVYEVI